MQLVKYDPFKDLDKLWNDDWGVFQSLPSLTKMSSLDMYEESGNLIAEISLPNFSKKEIDIKTDNGVLQISAEHKEKQEQKDKRHYYVRESSDHFFRRVALPTEVEADKAQATLKEGTLRITMPMPPKKNVKTVEVT